MWFRHKKYVLGQKPHRHHVANVILGAFVLTVVLVLSQMAWASKSTLNDSFVRLITGQTSSTSIVLAPVEDKKKNRGSAASAPGSAPIANIKNYTPKSYGIALGSSYPGFSEAELNKRFADMKSMGMTWVRLDIEWPNIQPSNSSQGHWNDTDKVINAARAHGLQVLGIIDYTPGWARASGCTSAQCPPANPADYAAFAVKVVNRYKPKGVHAWEIWNEPNNATFWHPKADATAYTKLLKAAYPAIKQADSSATVILAGPAPMDTDGTNISRRDFLKRVYSAGGKNYFDAAADHPYSFPSVPSDTNGRGWAQMGGTNPSMRSIMVANGDSAKKIWITEFGAPTDGPWTPANTSNSETVTGTWEVDENLQAKIMRESIRLYKSYSWAGPFFWYSYQDAGTDTDTNENFFGLVRHNGSKKPAYNTFKQYTP